MGIYINPGNDGFAGIVRGRYVDKTGLLTLFNSVLDTPRKLVCVSRPRRFGKSFAAKCLAAYYDCSCDSRALFDGLEITEDPSFERNLNSFNVVQVDMTAFTGNVGAEVVPALQEALLKDVAGEFSGVDASGSLTDAFISAVELSGRKFVFVIDEWDAVFREAEHAVAAQERYVKFLRLLFKNGGFTDRVVAGAYMTGILPIKRYGTQSAMTDFREFTMVQPLRYATYVGFTNAEVQQLCDEYEMDVAQMRRWYDGYEFAGTGHVYAPYSVMEACENGVVGPYWAGSDTYESLRDYIDMDFDGLKGDIVRALGGERLKVDPGKFQNDMTSVSSKDDVLTLLVHLGYFAYDAETGTARIPNEEVRSEFRRAVEESKHPETARIVRRSAQLLRSLIEGDEAAVAAGIQYVHDVTCSPLFYNDEQALRAVVRAAFITAADDYVRIEELPSGRGYADIVYLPKRGSSKPALVVELKWDKQPEAAIAQIRSRDYPQVLRGFGGPIVLAGITYDSNTKAHSCKIEQIQKPGK